MKTEINIGRDFSPVPAGRYVQDGPFSGETFRNRFLIEPARNNVPVTIDLSGTDGYGSSFLEEAFGGLVRELKMSPMQVKSIVRIQAKDPKFQTYVDEAYSYVEEAYDELQSAHKE